MHFILGTLSGVILGGVLGLATTPNSGKENQKIVKDYVSNVSTQTKEVTNQAGDLKSSIDNLMTEVNTIKGPFMDEINTIKSEYELELEPRIRRIQQHQEQLNKDVETMNESIK